MLGNKSNHSSCAQNQKYNGANDRPSSNNFRFAAKLIFITELLPVKANYVGGDTAVATGQISWSDKAVSNKAAFGKMFGFALVGKKSRVPRGCWCSPSPHNATVSFQSQRVLSIYTPYGTPVQSGKSKDVVYNDFSFGNFDAWIPKQQPGEIAKPDVNPDFGQHNGNRFGGKRNNTNDGKGHGQNRDDFARAGSKQLRIHSVSFTQSAAEVGAEK